ncbi:TetR/AcrR family transcriptional regulator [Pseudonocardia humida]|uniref:TetR/AcrR family transcriptional regulator n=1 Tax=Pseudonocardia humida TaxID=2800819 RepID=A0ABT1A0R9_9PSEU|nr:TetR/AcrR family transcriptional regulator [Pseudonocardia humida]MCO1656595.1 TetR/AcrR family transcriptional regulator [Pseudonocardia humida]
MTEPADEPARERILRAAEELFAEAGFDATPTSRVAERAGVPKGLVHYYFKRKPDLLAALVDRLPDEPVPMTEVVVPGDLEESLHRLVGVLDRALDSSAVLSHLLWREADTHPDVLVALRARYDRVVVRVREVIEAAGGRGPDVEPAAELLASAVSYRHSVARHADDERGAMRRELSFLARALEPRPHSN